MKHNIPKGWTKGEQLIIERRGSYIIVGQAVKLIFDLNRDIALDHVAYKHWPIEEWKEVTSFLAWWLSE